MISLKHTGNISADRNLLLYTIFFIVRYTLLHNGIVQCTYMLRDTEFIITYNDTNKQNSLVHGCSSEPIPEVHMYIYTVHVHIN